MGWGLLVRKIEKGLIKLLMGMYGSNFFFLVVCEGTGVMERNEMGPTKSRFGFCSVVAAAAIRGLWV